VAVNTNVTAIFINGPIDCATVTGATFYIKQDSGTDDGPSVSATQTGCNATSATLNPDSDLGNGLDYTAYVKTGITDDAGNALTINDSWTFTTAAAATTDVTDGFLPPNSASNGSDTDVLLSTFDIATSTGSDTVTAVAITRSGTGADADISAVKLYRDDGITADQWDASDTLLDTQTFSGGTVLDNL
jgi:hypothetical protein